MTCQKPNIPANILSRITKIFVTNLAEKCSGKDLSEFIRGYGDICDLYIARKRDKMGNRFGFVSFLDVKDCKELIKQIGNTRIGNCWLKANVARFTLEEGEICQEPVTIQKKHAQKEERMVPPSTSYYNGTRSFSDILTGRQEGKSVVIDNQVNAFRGLHGKSVVARMIDLEALKNIYVILDDLCPGLGKVQHLGGLSVLISFEYKDLVPTFLTAAREVIGKFSSLDVWEGQSFGYERLAWLKLVGIPLHLIASKVIDAVSSVFGKIIHRAAGSDSDDDLSYDYIGVLLGYGKRINEDVKLVWRDRKFTVWVPKESGERVLEFYKGQSPVEVHMPASEDEEEEASKNMDVEEPSRKRCPALVRIFRRMMVRNFW
ncbi:putative RNA recognition motif domain, nucleotide-binding alpha-beta plait domain superfamily [Helianthus debilis subsp. tardiflorus]